MKCLLFGQYLSLNKIQLHIHLDKETLRQKVNALCDKDWCIPTRIHPLKSFNNSRATVFVKREDESGFGISGYKRRKYASILPFWEKQQVKHLSILGNAFSNHIPAVLQVANEKSIAYELFLKRPRNNSLTGNAFLSHLLANPDSLHWIDKPPDEITFTKGSFLVPEGASCDEAFPGLASLPLECLNQLQQKSLQLDHVFMDAGTAMSAACFVAVYSQHFPATHFHIILVAGSEQEFKEELIRASMLSRRYLQWSIQLSLINLFTYTPVSAPSFGSTNATLAEFVVHIARSEGILLDLIYNAKLFYSAKKIINEKDLKGNILLIHSGGANSLHGFQQLF